MNVTLIGMPASGKSKVGELLAEKLGLKFLDVDRHLWERIHGKAVQEILDERGEKWYLAEEERLILEHTKGKDNLLISPPGSVAYLPHAMEHLKRISTIVYLKVPFETTLNNLKGTEPRAIVGLRQSSYDGEGFSKSLRELYDERCPAYEKYADITIDRKGKNSEGVAREIVKLLSPISKA
ncbi:MAG: shikimate kinase [bacterium]|nr:shikimate kinase [bacterium]